MADKNMEVCLNINESEESLSCVKKVIREYSGSCAPKLVLLTQKGCPHCEKEIERRKSDIEAGVIKHYDVFSPEGKDIAKKNNLAAVPDLLLVDCRGYMIE